MLSTNVARRSPVAPEAGGMCGVVDTTTGDTAERRRLAVSAADTRRTAVEAGTETIITINAAAAAAVTADTTIKTIPTNMMTTATPTRATPRTTTLTQIQR